MLAHDLRLFLLRPVAGAIHQLHSLNFVKPVLPAPMAPPAIRLAPQSCFPAMNCAGTSMVRPEKVSCSASVGGKALFRRCR